MPQEKTVNLQLFGVFRKCFDTNKVKISVPHECTLDHLRSAICQDLKQREQGSHDELVASSAFARDGMILLPEAMIADGDDLSILPPVCGG